MRQAVTQGLLYKRLWRLHRATSDARRGILERIRHLVGPSIDAVQVARPLMAHEFGWSVVPITHTDDKLTEMSVPHICPLAGRADPTTQELTNMPPREIKKVAMPQGEIYAQDPSLSDASARRLTSTLPRQWLQSQQTADTTSQESEE